MNSKNRYARREQNGGVAEVALQIRGLRKNFGTQEILRGIDLDVSDGEFLTLLGPSGSGKTTLLRIIAGFEGQSGGRIDLYGKNIAMLSPAHRNLGMVFQHYTLFPHLNVAENVAYGLKMHGWNRADLSTRVDEMLSMIGLSHLARRSPRELSGGQQQRVALARALAYQPKLLLMDEPLGALDRSLRLQMKEEIRRVHKQVGTTVIYVTHDQEEALALSDRVAIMKDGRLVALDTPEALYRRPSTRFVAEFFSGCNILAGEVVSAVHDAEEQLLHVGSEQVKVRTSLRGAVAVAVRPRAFMMQPIDSGLRVSGRIEDSVLLGDDLQLLVSTAENGQVTALVDAGMGSDLRVGDELSLWIARENCTVVGSEDG